MFISAILKADTIFLLIDFNFEGIFGKYSKIKILALNF